MMAWRMEGNDMYKRSHWDVLIVDDEPDVLAVTKLALKGVEVFGIPLRITTRSSKADALSYLQNPSEVPDLSLAIIDVVMETQHAGLELCEYIRNEMANRVTPLIIRTGQAGLAPEQEVIDKHDITAYITKVDATDERLKTLVKSSIRSFLYSRTIEGTSSWAHYLMENASDRTELLRTLRSCLLAAMTGKDGKRLEVLDGHMAFIVEDQATGIGEFEDTSAALAAGKELSTAKASSFPHGNFVHIDDRVHMALKPLGKDSPQVSFVARTNFKPVPDFFVRSWFDDMRTLRGLWSLMR
jgi:CheY-like chemotaxis protein